jgi:hypothetical protein
MECAACGGRMKRNAYHWSITWDRQEGYAKKRFSVSFHNKPECIRAMTERMDAYAWDQQTAAVLEDAGIDFGYGNLVEYEGGDDG